jgi:branched-subunit amino acid aminotransferase/4-amino-4-deoxychorismate lyase
MGVMPVCRIERRAIGNDKPGAMTTTIADAYRRAAASA